MLGSMNALQRIRFAIFAALAESGLTPVTAAAPGQPAYVVVNGAAIGVPPGAILVVTVGDEGTRTFMLAESYDLISPPGGDDAIA